MDNLLDYLVLVKKQLLMHYLILFSGASERLRYYQEAREGIYSGPLFLVSQLLQMVPLSLISTLIGSLIIFRGLKTELLCTEKSNGDRSCQAYSSYNEDKLATLEREGIKNW